jgi:hypothetical protein
MLSARHGEDLWLTGTKKQVVAFASPAPGGAGVVNGQLCTESGRIVAGRLE